MKKESLQEVAEDLAEGIAEGTELTDVTVTVTGTDGEVKAEAKLTPPNPITAEERQAEVNRIAEDIAEMNPRIVEAEQRLYRASEEQKSAKKAVESLHAELSTMALMMGDALSGTFQRRLPFSVPPRMTEDTGVALEVFALQHHGMTESECDKLVAADIKTIGDLEQRMRDDEWWMKKIKGFGEAKVEKLIDALAALRREHPHSEPIEAKAEEPAADVAKSA